MQPYAQQPYPGYQQQPPHQPGYQQQPPGYQQQPGYAPAPGYGAPQGQYAPAGHAYNQSAAAPYQPPQQGSVQDPAVAGWFQSIDTDRSGELDAAELQRALQMGGLSFGLNDVDAMVRAFDTRGRRKLNLEEFAKLHAFLTSVQTSFSYFDKDRSGTLQTSEVVDALRHAGFSLDPPVVQAMMNRHDANNNQNMSLDEFIRMCLFLQSCVRTFTAFDSNRTGRISLDFGQFVYACSHIA